MNLQFCSTEFNNTMSCNKKLIYNVILFEHKIIIAVNLFYVSSSPQDIEIAIYQNFMFTSIT